MDHVYNTGSRTEPSGSRSSCWNTHAVAGTIGSTAHQVYWKTEEILQAFLGYAKAQGLERTSTATLPRSLRDHPVDSRTRRQDAGLAPMSNREAIEPDAPRSCRDAHGLASSPTRAPRERCLSGARAPPHHKGDNER